MITGTARQLTVPGQGINHRDEPTVVILLNHYKFYMFYPIPLRDKHSSLTSSKMYIFQEMETITEIQNWSKFRE